MVMVLALSLGLHWAVLQTAAWTGMLVSYSRHSSFSEALSKTFDGKHPCSLCIAVQKGRAGEKEQDQQPVKSDLKLFLAGVTQSMVIEVPFHFTRLHSGDVRAEARRDDPPKPPPRIAGPDRSA